MKNLMSFLLVATIGGVVLPAFAKTIVNCKGAPGEEMVITKTSSGALEGNWKDLQGDEVSDMTCHQIAKDNPNYHCDGSQYYVLVIMENGSPAVAQLNLQGGGDSYLLGIKCN
jgi:hypothetical protein